MGFKIKKNLINYFVFWVILTQICQWRLWPTALFRLHKTCLDRTCFLRQTVWAGAVPKVWTIDLTKYLHYFVISTGTFFCLFKTHILLVKAFLFPVPVLNFVFFLLESRDAHCSGYPASRIVCRTIQSFLVPDFWPKPVMTDGFQKRSDVLQI